MSSPASAPGADDPEPGDDGHEFDEADGPSTAAPQSPVNWNLLTAEEAEAEWITLNRWVNWLRRTYGVPASIVTPLWHRHPELVWELSALHLHLLCAYDPDQHASAAIGWHHDFADARQRLHEWVANCGTRLDRDGATRQTAWPGEPPVDAIGDLVITHRDEDFVTFVLEDVERRREAERLFYAAAGGSAAYERSDPKTEGMGLKYRPNLRIPIRSAHIGAHPDGLRCRLPAPVRSRHDATARGRRGHGYSIESSRGRR